MRPASPLTDGAARTSTVEDNASVGRRSASRDDDVGRDSHDTDGIGEGTVLGPYRLGERLGEGGMGTVYLARHVQLGRLAAIKVLKPEHAKSPTLVQRFFAEARAVNTVDHPHIVQVFDFADRSASGGAVYLVMEHLRGEVLTRRLQRGPMALALAVSLVRQIAEALSAAHRVDVVHRDIKPDNIFLLEGPTPVVKVLDFGVAKLLTEPSTGLTQAGGFVGTPTYMAPEQAASLETDARTDVYALGALFFELLRGHPPFTETSLGPLMVEILTQPAPAVGSHTQSGERLPPSLQALVARCLAKLPDDRPASMAALIAQLDALDAGALDAGAKQLAGDGSRAAARRLRRRRGKLEAGALAAAALTLTLGFGWLGDRAKGEGDRAVFATEEVTLTVRSEPRGAAVVREDTGQPLGVTPLEVNVARGSAAVPLRVSLAGHTSALERVRLEDDVRLDVQLAPANANPATPVAPVTNGRHSLRDAVVNPFTP